MQNTPFISVLLPVYNCEKYIAGAVQSILNQTYTHFELLIIDDCSTDTTLQICNSFQDERIVLIEKEKNSGLSNSLNYGISIAKGKYIARMDGDDISLPERFEKQVAFLEANEDVVLCGTSYRIIGSDKIIHVPKNHEDIKAQLLSGNCIAHPSVMLKKSTLQTNSIFYKTEMEPAEDYDMWVRLLSIGTLHNLQEILLEYRLHENQVSSSRAQKQKIIATDIKFDLLKNINYVFSEKEELLYKKFISNEENLASSDLLDLITLLSNLNNLKNNSFFDEEKLISFLRNLETKIINRYFINRKQFSPAIYIEYIKLKFLLNRKLTLKDELKLALKALLCHRQIL